MVKVFEIGNALLECECEASKGEATVMAVDLDERDLTVTLVFDRMNETVNVSELFHRLSFLVGAENVLKFGRDTGLRHAADALVQQAKDKRS